ncbi:uncharacterized protein LOC126885452 [Diabrotica virgifera virgifera]|uniref:HAT C-terminal dimerisation domain-containing protein n=1 Tax=Diabrotica virgifera virgifera TaxID=50390 RepID=A0ABM5KCS7_DIAVI|nr:uncharacterized protein LOC126885452 [Diabrotica virgifera virgifera]
MSICCRYVLESGIRERFLGFVQLTKLDALALANKIQHFLNHIGLNIQLCVSQSYDGASVMSGKFSGVQALMREITGNPCPYVHCHAHRLNLVLVDVSKRVQSVGDTIGLLEAIYAFQSASTLRNELFSFEVKTKSGTKKLKVPQHSDTRWVSKYKGVNFFKTQFSSIVVALQKCAQNKAKPREAAEAKGLLTQFRSFDVIYFLVCLDEILCYLNILSKQLQSSNIDIGKSLRLIKATIESLCKMRTDDKFEELYKKAQDIFQVQGSVSDFSVENRPIRKQTPSSSLSDFLVFETTGKVKSTCNDESVSKKTQFKAELFSIVDNISEEMEKRFSENSSLLACISSCNPNSQNFLDPKELCSFAKFWGKDEEFCIQLKAQCDLGKSMFSKCKSTEDLYKELFSFGSFNELRYIVSVVLVIPVSSATAERSFSSMRRIKNCLRSTMMGQRLHSLGVISIERELSYNLLCHPEIVVDEFAAQKGRRLKFLLK